MATVTEVETETGREAEAGPATFAPHPLTIDRYERMIEAGIIGKDEPIFLWRGRIVEKMPKGSPHGFALLSLYRLLMFGLPEGWHPRQETPVAVGDRSMPEPDISVARGTLRDYSERHPRVGDVAILVEVADSSLAIEGYAAGGVETYWIVNIPEGRVEVYTQPTGPADGQASYRSRRDYGPEDEVPVELDGREVGRVAVREILP